MRVGRVKVSAVPEYRPGDGKADTYYRAKIDWLDSRVTFILPVAQPTQEDALDRGVDMLDWLKSTYGEEYELV